MTTSMDRLQEKVDTQNKTAESLRKRFKDAVEIAINDGGFSFSEAEYFGPKVLKEVFEQMKRE